MKRPWRVQYISLVPLRLPMAHQKYNDVFSGFGSASSGIRATGRLNAASMRHFPFVLMLFLCAIRGKLRQVTAGDIAAQAPGAVRFPSLQY